jgi:hypothetical protein
MFLAYVCQANFIFFHMDVKSVFLNDFIMEEVYVEQPQVLKILIFPTMFLNS